MNTSPSSWNKFYLTLFSILILTACSGGGGGDNNSNPPNNNSTAPNTLSASQVTLSIPGQDNRVISLIDAANWQETRSGATAQGTYLYHPVGDGRTASLTLTETGGEQTLTLNFASTNSGTFRYTSGATGEGTFTVARIQDPGNGGGGGENPPPPTGNAPSSLSGRTMFATRTYTSTGPTGQTHKYTFAAQTYHDSDAPEESDGTYTYQPNTDDAVLELTYTGPATFEGDKHHINLHFTSPTQGTFTSTYDRGDGTTIVINGTFELE